MRKREWRSVVETAKALGMYDSKLLSVAAGAHVTAISSLWRRDTQGYMVIWISPRLLLGHGGGEHARLVGALVGKKVVGVAAFEFTLRYGLRKAPLGMAMENWATEARRVGGEEDELLPRLVEGALG